MAWEEFQEGVEEIEEAIEDEAVYVYEYLKDGYEPLIYLFVGMVIFYIVAWWYVFGCAKESKETKKSK